MNDGRRAMEKLWKDRSEDAKLKFDQACRELREVERAISSGTTEESAYVYRNAVRAETAALVEYARVLRAYTDLVAYGMIPNEEPRG
jgi:hypothetical protein